VERRLDALERQGPENVRATLSGAYRNAGSGAAVSVGSVTTMTKGFAQEWLAWHDRRKVEREAAFRNNQIFWTRWAALAASIAAAGAAAIGWGVSIYSK